MQMNVFLFIFIAPLALSAFLKAIGTKQTLGINRIISLGR